MVVDISEASEIRVSNERYCATHHHSEHVSCRSKRSSKIHQFSSNPTNRGYDRNYVLHSPHSCLESRNCLLVKVLKSLLHLIQNWIVGVNCEVKKDVEEQVRCRRGCKWSETPGSNPRIYRMDQF